MTFARYCPLIIAERIIGAEYSEARVIESQWWKGKTGLWFLATLTFLGLAIPLTGIFVLPRVVTHIAKTACQIDGRTGSISVFFWLVVAISSLPAAVFILVIYGMRQNPSEKGQFVLLLLFPVTALGIVWPAILADARWETFYSRGQRQGDIVSSPWEAEVLHSMATPLFAAMAVSIFSAFVLPLIFRKLGLRESIAVPVLSVLILAVVVFLVGRYAAVTYENVWTNC